MTVRSDDSARGFEVVSEDPCCTGIVSCLYATTRAWNCTVGCGERKCSHSRCGNTVHIDCSSTTRLSMTSSKHRAVALNFDGRTACRRTLSLRNFTSSFPRRTLQDLS